MDHTPISDPKVQRKERRFRASELPDALKSVVVFLHGEELEAHVVNASRSGFGFRLPTPAEQLVRGLPVSLLFSSLGRRLTGTVAFLEKETEGTCRVGVRLEESLAHDTYIALIAGLEESL